MYRYRLAHSTIVFLIIHLMLVKCMYNGQLCIDQPTPVERAYKRWTVTEAADSRTLIVKNVRDTFAWNTVGAKLCSVGSRWHCWHVVITIKKDHRLSPYSSVTSLIDYAVQSRPSKQRRYNCVLITSLASINHQNMPNYNQIMQLRMTCEIIKNSFLNPNAQL